MLSIWVRGPRIRLPGSEAHFQAGLFQSQLDPLLGQFLKTLVLGQLLPNLGEELRANELGGAFSPVHIAQLIIRTVTLGILGILTFTTGLAAGVVLPG